MLVSIQDFRFPLAEDVGKEALGVRDIRGGFFVVVSFQGTIKIPTCNVIPIVFSWKRDLGAARILHTCGDGQNDLIGFDARRLQFTFRHCVSRAQFSVDVWRWCIDMGRNPGRDWVWGGLARFLFFELEPRHLYYGGEKEKIKYLRSRPQRQSQFPAMPEGFIGDDIDGLAKCCLAFNLPESPWGL